MAVVQQSHEVTLCGAIRGRLRLGIGVGLGLSLGRSSVGVDKICARFDDDRPDWQRLAEIERSALYLGKTDGVKAELANGIPSLR